MSDQDANVWAQIDAMLAEAGLKPCLWFGMPPCPLCGGGHGDPNCSPVKDAEERAAVARGASMMPGGLHDPRTDAPVSSRFIRECFGCLEEAFTRPVQISTCYGDGEIDMCINCRVNFRDDKWSCLASTMQHRRTLGFRNSSGTGFGSRTRGRPKT